MEDDALTKARDQDEKAASGAASERDETEAEREDRKWNDMLQELRVLQTSAQLTAGFLLTLPFQQAFARLSDDQERFYLVLVILAAVVTAFVLTPVAIHRRLSGQQVKHRVVAAGHLFMRLALISLAALVAGIVTFIFDVVTEASTALVVGIAMAVGLVGLLLVLPRMLVARE